MDLKKLINSIFKGTAAGLLVTSVFALIAILGAKSFFGFLFLSTSVILAIQTLFYLTTIITSSVIYFKK